MNELDLILESKFGIKRRLVEVEDASFILSLRLDAKLGRFLSKTEEDIVRQEEWIREYKQREADHTEFYYIFENNEHQKYGVYRIYNFDITSYEAGSWLFIEKSPNGLSILADLCVRDIAFTKYSFEYCRFEVRKENKAVVRYHQKFQPKLIGEDSLNYYYMLSKDNYFSFRNQLLKIYGNGTN
jgi:hypothetical protein